VSSRARERPGAFGDEENTTTSRTTEDASSTGETIRDETTGDGSAGSTTGFGVVVGALSVLAAGFARGR